MSLESVHCHLRDTKSIQMDVTLRHQSSGEIESLTLVATPRVDPQTGQVTLTQIHYLENQAPSQQFTGILVNKAKEVLSLQNFEMRGISLRVQTVEIKSGYIRLHAIAKMTHFPSK
ncbi:MAG: hypothetical protein F6K03_06145 [Kamptonema sp. SIO4C4]|nr:hypothetical protein [Kamptonema sp. SIO4C4]